ncbi:MAG UNVERIFIED_CONTAM: hypothetical protein LVT10_21330 [Anaerolineae bacterium]
MRLCVVAIAIADGHVSMLLTGVATIFVFSEEWRFSKVSDIDLLSLIDRMVLAIRLSIPFFGSVFRMVKCVKVSRWMLG